MTFRDQMKVDVLNCHLDPSVFAESAVYYTGGDTLNGHPVNVIVNRSPDEVDAEEPNLAYVEVLISNDALLGVDQPECLVDFIDLELAYGQARRRYRVESIVSGDAAAWRLRCVGLGDV